MNLLLPYAVGATAAPGPVTTVTTAESSEPDCPSSTAFSAGGAIKEAGSGSSPSAASSSSGSGQFSFSTPRRHSPSTSPLCFGAGGAGILLWTSSKALSRASKNPPKEEGSQAASMAPKGDVVGRFLRRISRRLRRTRATKEPPPPRGAGTVNNTARARAEAVASAVAYCKETLRCGTSPPPPLSSPCLDWWLHDMQEEIIAGAAAQCDECGDSQHPPPRPRRDRSLLERSAKDMQHCKDYSPRPPSPPSTAAAESPHHGHIAGDSTFPEQTTHARHAPRMQLPCIHDAQMSAAAAAETGKPAHPSDAAAGEMETCGGFTELEFVETFDGNEELIDRHFITVQI